MSGPYSIAYTIYVKKFSAAEERTEAHAPFSHPPAEVIQFAAHDEVPLLLTSDSRRQADSIDNARFVPGTILAERYRITGLLGQGGMGEVYRAEDLLGRPPRQPALLPLLLFDGFDEHCGEDKRDD